MAPPPEVPPARVAGVPIQRVDQDHEEVPAFWLTEPEHMDAADRVDRLAADYDMITGLALERFQGQRYDVFQTELAKYGSAVIGGWIRRGLIFARCRERGFGGLPEAPMGAFDDPDTVAELAGETVCAALWHFREDILKKQRWDYRRGASIRTFFIGQCLIRFANIYRAWYKTEASRGYHLADLGTLDDLERRRDPGVSELVADQDLAERLMRGIADPRVRQALGWIAADVPHAVIAQRLGVSVKAVERMLANERARLKIRRGIA